MTGFVSYIADLLVYYTFAGITLHLADRFAGVPAYQWWYNDSRTIPLVKERGFLYGHPGGIGGRLHKAALWISGIQSLSFLYKGKVDLVTEIPAFFLEAWFLMLGFHIGKYVYNYMRGEQKLADIVYQTSPRVLLAKAGEGLQELLNYFRPASSPKVARAATPAAPTEPAAPEAPKVHWRDQIKSYTQREK
jgi:hypothetical protein